MSQTKSATTVEQLVSETDHVQLSRLVTELAWRATTGVPIPSTSYSWIRGGQFVFAPEHFENTLGCV